MTARQLLTKENCQKKRYGTYYRRNVNFDLYLFDPKLFHGISPQKSLERSKPLVEWQDYRDVATTSRPLNVTTVLSSTESRSDLTIKCAYLWYAYDSFPAVNAIQPD